MKKWLVKIILSGLLAFGLECLCLVIQYIYQTVNHEYWIKLGFPYKIYAFSADFEFHGVNAAGFIDDALLLFVFSFLIVHVWMKVRAKRSMFSENERIDEGIQQNNR